MVGSSRKPKENQKTAKKPQIIMERNWFMTHSKMVLNRRRSGPVKKNIPLYISSTVSKGKWGFCMSVYMCIGYIGMPGGRL
jgi:hypothetical protein